MKLHQLTSLTALFAGLSILPAIAADTPPLVAKPPIVVPGGPGGFDWMTTDASRNLVFASHKGTKSTAVINSKTGKVLPSIPTGTAQGVEVDMVDNKFFAGDDEEQKVVVMDRKTFKTIAEIPVTGPVDAIAFDPKNGMLYADHDDGTDVWVINAKTNKLVGTIIIPTAPEYIQYEPITDRLYQNIKSSAVIEVINPNTNTIEATWPTAPMTSPHGLAIDSKTGHVFSAGGGLLEMFDIKTGKVLSSVAIASKSVDQIAFDPSKKRVYCACVEFISVAQETDNGLTLLANIPSPKRAHTLTVDPKSHNVWICYADATNSYLQEFVAH